MTVKEKLQLIQQISGLNQTELARRLGVTFAALNRWMNAKASPRVKVQEKIDELLRTYSGEKKIPENITDAKLSLISKKQKLYPYVLGEILNNPDILDEFILSLTYNSNRIEGSTLTKDETAAVLFQDVSLPNKSITEQLEAKNHETALRYLFDFLHSKKPIKEEFILELHGRLLNSIRSDAGNYRNHPVRIAGANVPTANYLKISNLMKKLIRNINSKSRNIIEKTALVHSTFEQIHPFSDGNGRVGRLLVHVMLLYANLPPAVIKQEKRRFYLRYLNKAQLKDDMDDLENFIADAVLEGFKIIERKV